MDWKLAVTSAAITAFFFPAPDVFERWRSFGQKAALLAVWCALFAAFSLATAGVLVCIKSWWVS